MRAGRKIRIHHECKGRIDLDKLVQRIPVWNHEACRVMTKGVPEGQILPSSKKNGFFSFLPLIPHFMFQIFSFAEMRHGMMTSH